MVDITGKKNTLREAVAEAVVQVSQQATIEALLQGTVPKGNVFEVAKVAGLFAVKNTHLSIPDCHPLPIEYTSVNYQVVGKEVYIQVKVKTIYKTGVEVEAMHAASIVALTMYDMLKPIDKGVEIGQIRLVEKKGGKSHFKVFAQDLTAAVIVCSDSVSAGQKEDRAGQAAIEILQRNQISISAYEIIPDDKLQIQEKVKKHQACNILIFVGGTGLSNTDVTPEALLPIIDRRIPGIEEAMRNYGQNRIPYAMLSRSIAGTVGDCMVLALPGSTKGAKESMEAIFPDIIHVFDVQKAIKHQKNE